MKWYIFILAGLIVGYGFGSVLSPSDIAGRSDENVEDVEEVALANSVVAEDAEAAKALHEAELAKAKAMSDAQTAEIAGLNTALDNARSEISRHVAELDKLRAGGSRAQAARTRGTGESWKEREERMKKENPEEFAEREKQRDEFKKKLDGVVAEKSTFLLNIDTADMSEQEKKDHEELQARIAESWETMNKMQEGEFPKGEDWGKMRENYTAIQDLYGKERDYVLKQVGKDLGYDKKESADFSTYIKDVFEKTSPNPPRGMFSGFGRGRRGGGRSTRTATPQGADAVK